MIAEIKKANGGVSVKTDDKTISVVSPYYPEFVDRAKALGGKWSPSAKAWVFDARTKAKVDAALVHCYGTDGSEVPAVTLLMDLGKESARIPGRWDAAVMFDAGRQLARRRGRDCDVDMGEGVIVESGEFPSRGGSAKSPSLGLYGGDPCGIVLRIYDVPEALATRLVAGRDCFSIATD